MKKHLYSLSIFLVSLLSFISVLGFPVYGQEGSPSPTSASPSSAPAPSTSVSSAGSTRTSTDCVITKVGSPADPAPALPSECISSGGGGSIGVPTGQIDGSCTLTGEYPSDLRGEIQKNYKITLDDSYSSGGEKQIYELLTCLSNSKFPTLLSNATITIHNAISPSLNSIGMDCNSGSCNVWIPDTTNALKFILTHELGHIISYTNPRETISKTEFENLWSQEGGVSAYSRKNGDSGCLGSPSMEEDFAETVAYFFNPNAGAATGACNSDDANPNPFFSTTNYPLHTEFAKKVFQ